MASEIVPAELDEDVGLSNRQVQALEKLNDLGASPAPVDEKTGKSKYDSRPQIRALQLVYEGRLGGPHRGQGRRPRAPRAAEVIAEKIRESPRIKKIVEAIDRALTEDAGPNANLKAVQLVMDIENREAALRLREDEHDELGGTKEELLATLFGLVAEPGTRALIEGQVIDGTSTDITEATVIGIEGSNGDTSREASQAQPRHASVARTNGSHRDPADLAEAGGNGGKPGRDDRGRPARDRAQGPNPVLAAKVRRAKH